MARNCFGVCGASSTSWPTSTNSRPTAIGNAAARKGSIAPGFSSTRSWRGGRSVRTPTKRPRTYPRLGPTRRHERAGDPSSRRARRLPPSERARSGQPRRTDPLVPPVRGLSPDERHDLDLAIGRGARVGGAARRGAPVVTRLQASARVLELAREVGAGALELRDPTDRTALERATEILAKLGIWLESSETPHPACPHCHGVGL